MQVARCLDEALAEAEMIGLEKIRFLSFFIGLEKMGFYTFS